MRRDVFQAIADPTRREILSLMAQKEVTPSHLAERFPSSRQAISKHIRILLECDLIASRSQGREIFYTFQPKKLKEVDRWLRPFREMWEARFNQLDNVLSKLKK